MIKLVKFIKDGLLAVPVTLLFHPFSKLLLTLLYFNKLIIWIRKNKKTLIYSDFYSPLRNYNKRFELYAFLLQHFQLKNEPVTYLEYGVASGASFNWWLQNNQNPASQFYGFDTFEGLPENWGSFYKKGDMSSAIPTTGDSRAQFIKGLFQDKLKGFIGHQQDLLHQQRRLVIHMDADLYSSTAFVLSMLYPFLKKGDIITFDEFSVPMHEFKAFYEFTHNFYITLKPVAAVNNFYQTAFVVA
ncbi:MAG: class I SAM-dependent methyltransferase [Chitinophagaceae bacterium]|nr:class I SAM-dependent methyltransferase [Chitinophagaceae bacterium]HQY40507.1 class I SAM-dependent methyltransferase [Ferruginibacter sp.]